MGGEFLVAVHHEKGVETGFELVDDGRGGIIEETLLQTAFFPTDLNIFFHPGPGLIVEVYEVLVVKMNAWKFLFGHRVSLGPAQRQYITIKTRSSKNNAQRLPVQAEIQEIACILLTYLCIPD
jgi:hypothetical protein